MLGVFVQFLQGFASRRHAWSTSLFGIRGPRIRPERLVVHPDSGPGAPKLSYSRPFRNIQLMSRSLSGVLRQLRLGVASLVC
jgi:hypothetical protein